MDRHGDQILKSLGEGLTLQTVQQGEWVLPIPPFFDEFCGSLKNFLPPFKNSCKKFDKMEGT
jgi:hypothetical protein